MHGAATRVFVASALFVLAVTAAIAAAPVRIEEVVPGSPMHGIEGITVGPDDALYVASITARSLYRVDPESGAVSVFVPPPDGGADDLTFAKDGTAVWTGGAAMNALMSRSPGARPRALVSETPGLNAVRFAPDGRLYFTRIFGGDGLYEADPDGVKPVRPIAEHIGGLNAFDFTADGAIVGPLFFRGTVNRFDPVTGSSVVIADGFSFPSAVRVLPDGYLVLNYRRGEIWRLDANATSRRLVGRVAPPADNFIVRHGRELYVTSTAWNGITEFDLATGGSRRVTWGALTAPGMLARTRIDGQELILIADDTAVKTFDPQTRAVAILDLGAAALGTRGILPMGERYAVESAYQPGTVTLVDPHAARPPVAIGGFGRAMGLAAVPGGLLVADYPRGEVVELRVDGDAVSRRVIASHLVGPVGLAISTSGSIYVSEFDAGRITELKPNPGAEGVHSDASWSDESYASVPLVGGLLGPEGIAFAADGRLLIVEVGGQALRALDPRTRRLAVLAKHLALGLTDGNEPQKPFLMAGIVTADDGSAYLSGDLDNVLYRVSFPGRK
jgi:sugar lactone lactonase YvrE